MSSVDPSKTSEAGGLQGTAQNLGSSLGTAVIGAVLIAGLTTGFTERIADNPQLPADMRETIVANNQAGIDIAPVDDVEQLAQERGASAQQARVIAADYGEAQLEALRHSLGAVALVALLSLWFTRRLPHAGASPEAGRAPPAEPAVAA
jgi:hypothetical protein